MIKVETQIKWAKLEYESLLASGMFWEFYPNLSGNWINDKMIWIKNYLLKEKSKKDENK